jgi:glutamine amidotransferase
MKISLVEYDAGNLPSVERALARQGLATERAATLAGRVAALPPTDKLPHMGWNQLRRVRSSVLLESVPADAYFYFAHTFAALNAGEAAVALCDHAAPFVAALERGNLFAVQFHPEKSGDMGARVLANFIAHADRVAHARASSRS